MGNEFSLDGAGLTPLADIHAQVADGLARLTGAPQTSDVAESFGNIAFAVNSALDGVTESRAGTFQATKHSSNTIAELLNEAHQRYEQGDQQGAEKLRAAAEVLEGSSGAGVPGAGVPGTGAADAGGGGAQVAGQLASQIGQQLGQFAQGMAQSAQGLAQGLAQLPQQVMQGLQGIVDSASKGAESSAAATDDEKVDDPKERERADAEKRAEEERAQRDTPPVQSEGARPGQSADAGPAPVPAPPPQRPEPAPTRPQ